MDLNKKDLFPGGSKNRVNTAGQNVRLNKASMADFQAIEAWRAAHRTVLNTFQASLRNRTKGKEVIVAQRHKRKSTIFHKLGRFPWMELARMDDVAGCRLIFKSVDELNKFREEFHKARFKHKRRNNIDKYNYIKKPKETGYRGIHDVYSYDVNSLTGKYCKGLLVEIQYRTVVQHAWATAVEVIGFITESQPKFQQGDKSYEQCMALASEMLARSHENLKGPFPDMSNRELLSSFDQLNSRLHLLTTLAGLNEAQTAVSTSNRNLILIFNSDGSLEIRSHREATDALKELFKLEKDYPNVDLVLVKADTNEEVRIAFKNYFSDAKDFIRLLNESKNALEQKTDQDCCAGQAANEIL